MPIDDGGDSNGSPRHWMLVFALVAISIYAFIDRVVLALLVDPIRQDLGASDLQMALLMGPRAGSAVLHRCPSDGQR